MQIENESNRGNNNNNNHFNPNPYYFVPEQEDS